MQGVAAVLQPVDGVTLTAQGLMNALAKGYVILDQ
jgi:fructose-1,6-bisphosphatase/sedoheptulose 1,7-bisphosphatase-like protein